MFKNRFERDSVMTGRRSRDRVKRMLSAAVMAVLSGGVYTSQILPGKSFELSFVPMGAAEAVDCGAYANVRTNGYSLSNVTLSGYVVSNAGAAIILWNGSSTSATISSVTFSGNWAKTQGGAYFQQNSCTSTLTSCTFTNNTSPQGGGLNNQGGTMTIRSSTFGGTTDSLQNKCGASGRGRFEDIQNTGTITFDYGTTSIYGGIWNQGTLNITKGTLALYSAAYISQSGVINISSGAALNMGSSSGSLLTKAGGFTNAGTFTMGSGTLNASVVNKGSVELKGTTVKGSFTWDTSQTSRGSSAGMLTFSAGTFNLSDSDYKADGQDVKISSDAVVSMTGSNFKNSRVNSNSGNFVLTDGGTIDGSVLRDQYKITTRDCGGAFYNASTVTGMVIDGGTYTAEVAGCTYKKHYVTNAGGAYFGATNSTNLIKDSTFVDNSASQGGAVYVQMGCITTISGCTFDNNSSSATGGRGGAICFESSTSNVGGVLNVIDCSFGETTVNKSGTANVDITSKGATTTELNLSGTNKFYSGIDVAADAYSGTYSVNVTGGITSFHNAAYITGHKKIAVSSGGTLDFSASSGSITGVTSSFTNAGTLTMGSGSLANTLTNTGTLNINGGSAAISIKDTVKDGYNQGTINVNSGTYNWTSNTTQARQLNLSGSAKVSLNAATSSITGDKTATNITLAGTSVLNISTTSAATITGTSATHTNADIISLAGTSQMTIDGGSKGITVNGASSTSSDAVIKLAKGTTMNLKGIVTVKDNKVKTAGAFSVDTATVNMQGTITFSNNTAGTTLLDITNNGTIVIKDDNSSATTLDMTGGISGGDKGSVTIGDGTTTKTTTVTLTSKAGITGQNTLTVKSDGILDLGGSQGSLITKSGLTNAGIITMGTGTLGGAVTNTGTINLSGGAVTSDISDTKSGSYYQGTINISNGTFDQSGKILQAKTVKLTGSSVLKVSADKCEISGSATLAAVDVGTTGSFTMTNNQAAVTVTLLNKTAATAGYLAIHDGGSAAVDGGSNGITFSSQPSGSALAVITLADTGSNSLTISGKTDFTNNTGTKAGAISSGSSTNVINITGTTVFSGNKKAAAANDIYNAGTVNITGTADMDGGISGSSGTVIIGDGVNAGKLILKSAAQITDQTNIEIKKNSLLDMSETTGSLRGADSKFENAGTIVMGNGTIGSNLVNTGTITATKAGIFEGNINSSSVDSKITIAGAKFTGDVTNSGTIVITGGEIHKITNNNVKAATEADANCLKDIITNNNGTVTLTGGTLNYAITGNSGKTVINGDVLAKALIDNNISAADGITVKEGKSLELDADYAGTGIVNNGTLTLTGDSVDKNGKSAGETGVSTIDTLTKPVTGQGKIIIKGNIVSTGNISTTSAEGIVISTGKSLSIGAANLNGETYNDGGILTLTGDGTLTNDIYGDSATSAARYGVLFIGGNVVTERQLAVGSITINSGYSLSVNADKLYIDGTGNVENKGTLKLTGGTLKDSVTTAAGSAAGTVEIVTGKSVLLGNATGNVGDISTQNVIINGTLRTDTDTTGDKTLGKAMVLNSGGVLDLRDNNDNTYIVDSFKSENGTISFDMVKETGSHTNYLAASDHDIIRISGTGEITGKIKLGSINMNADIYAYLTSDEVPGKAEGELEFKEIDLFSGGTPGTLKIFETTTQYGDFIYTFKQKETEPNSTKLEIKRDPATFGLREIINAKDQKNVYSGTAVSVATYSFNTPTTNYRPYADLEEKYNALKGVASKDADQQAQYDAIVKQWKNIINAIYPGDRNPDKWDGTSDLTDKQITALKGYDTIIGNEGLGTLTPATGKTLRTVTINGNGNPLNGGSYPGVTVNSGGTLNIVAVSSIDNFKDNIVVTNNGNLTVKDSTMQLNAGVTGTGDVLTGVLTFDNTTVTVGTYSPDQKETTYQLKQKSLVITLNSALKAYAQDLTVADISNSGSVELRGGTTEDKTSVLAGTSITGNDGTVTIGIGQYIKITKGKTVAGQISTAGNLTANADSFSGGKITNTGTMILTGGEMKVAVTGTGTTKITGMVTDTAALAQTDLTIDTTGKLTATADTVTVTNTITDNGELELTGGSNYATGIQFNNAVTGSGKTTINGHITILRNISATGGITVTDGKTLTGDADLIDVAVTNNGTVYINADGADSDTLQQTITGGSIIISSGTVTADAGNLKGAVINETNNLILAGGTSEMEARPLTVGIAGGGNTVVGTAAQAAYISAQETVANIITVTANSGLTIRADNLQNTITNNGSLITQVGSLNYAVTGSGSMTVTGMVINNATVTQNNFTVRDAAGSFKTAVTDLNIANAITNNGSMTFTGAGTISNGNGISGTGQLYIEGNITSGGAVTNSICVGASRQLTIDPDNIQGEIKDNAGTLVLNADGTLNQKITGTGTIQISGNITNTAGNTLTQSSVTINSGGLTTNGSDLNITDSLINNGALILTGGSIGKDITGSGSTTINTTGTVILSGNVAQNLATENGILAYGNGSAVVSGNITVGKNSQLQIGVTNTTGSITLESDATNRGLLTFTAGGEYTKTISGEGDIKIAEGTNLQINTTTVTGSSLNMDICGTLTGIGITVKDLTIENNGMLNMTNGDCTDVFTVEGNLNSNNGGLNFDIDLSSVTAKLDDATTAILTTGFDTINVKGNSEGILNLANISLLRSAPEMEIGAKVAMKIIKGNAGSVTIGNSVAVTSDGAKYVFGQYVDSDSIVQNGYLQVEKSNGYSLWQIVTGNSSIGDTYDPAKVKNYVIINDEWDAAGADENQLTGNGSGTHMGTLGSLTTAWTDGTKTAKETSRAFTVSGNGYGFRTSGSVTGFTVSKNVLTLTLADISEISGFKDYIVNNTEGTVNIQTGAVTDISSNIINNSMLNMVKGRINLNADITGSGTLTVMDMAQVTAGEEVQIEQKTLNIRRGGALSADADALILKDGGNYTDIANDGIFTITGGTLNNKVTGTGSLIIDADKTDISGNAVPGEVTVLNAVTDSIEVKKNNTLTVAAVYVQGRVTNNGTVALGSGTLGSVIADGSDAGEIILKSDVTAAADCLQSKVINAANTLKLNSGTLIRDITGSNGTVTVAGSVINTATISQKSLNIAGSGSLTTASSQLNVSASVENNGTLTLTGNNNSFATGITGSGTLNITGSISTTGNISQNRLNISGTEAVFTADISRLSLGEAGNAGKLVLAGNGRIEYPIKGYTDGVTVKGTTVINGTITTDKIIDNSIVINDSADSLTIGAAHIGGSVTNNGGLILTGNMTGTEPQYLQNSVTGGSLDIRAGSIANKNGNKINVQTLKTETYGALAVNMDDLTVGDTTIANDGTLVLTGGILNNAVVTGNKGSIENSSGTFVIDETKLGSKLVIQNEVTVNNNIDSVIVVQPGSTLTIKPDYAANGAVLRSEVDGSGKIITAAKIVIDQAGTFGSAIGGAGTVTINKDVFMSETATFLPVDQVPQGGVTVPVSGVSLNLNAQMSIGSAGMALSSGAVRNLTLGTNGHLNLVNGKSGTLAVTGDFDAGTNGMLSLDVLGDGNMDSFFVGGNATGTLNLGTINIASELITPVENETYIKVGDTCYYGYKAETSAGSGIYTEVYLDKDGHKTEEDAEKVKLSAGGKVDGTVSIAIWKDIPIMGTDNLTINGTSVVCGMYLYTITYEPNSGANNDKQLKIIKSMGNYTFHDVIQGAISNEGKTDEFRAAKIDTYSLTEDVYNVEKVTLPTGERTANGGKDLGILTRIDAGSWQPDGRSGGATNRKFTINGNGHNMDGAGWAGITVQEGDTLVLTNIAKVSNFAGGTVAVNNGTLLLDGGTIHVFAGVSAEAGKGTLEINGADVTIENTEQHLTKGAKRLDITTGKYYDEAAEIGMSVPAEIKFQQNRLNLIGGSVSANANALDINIITNDGTLNLLDSAGAGAETVLKGTVTGSGTVVVKAANLTANNEIANNIMINTTGKLTVKADNIAGHVNNSGTLVLTGGSLARTVEGGNVEITDNLSSSVNNFTGNTLVTVADTKVLKFTAGELNQQIGDATHTSGTTQITGSIKAGKAVYTRITVDNNSSLTADAWFLQGDTTNNGTVVLTSGNSGGGNLTKSITGGNVNIAGDIKTDGSNLKGDVNTINNAATLTLTGGELTQTLSGEGHLNITGDVTVTDAVMLNISGGITVDNGGELSVKADNIGCDILNNSTLRLSGTQIKKAVAGTGNLILDGDFTVLEKDLVGVNQNITVTAGRTLTTDNKITTVGSLTLQDGAVLNMQNSATETLNISRLVTGSGTAKLRADVDFAGRSNDMVMIAAESNGTIVMEEYTVAAEVKGINVLSELEGEVGTKTTVKLFDGNVSNLELTQTVSTQLGAYSYLFTQTETAGTYTVEKKYGKTLKEVINNKENSGITGTYILQEDYKAGLNMGRLTRLDAGGENTAGGTVQREFTIDGRGCSYSGEDFYTGIIVGEGDILNIQNISAVTEWEEYAVKNSGTLNLTAVGALNAYITGDTGNTNITGDMVIDENAGIEQKNITVNGGTLTVKGKLQTQTLTGNGAAVLNHGLEMNVTDLTLSGGVVNNGELVLAGGHSDAPATLTMNITGNGITKFTGAVNATVQQLGQAVNNKGSLNITGDGTLPAITGKGDISISGTVTASGELEVTGLDITGKVTAAGNITAATVTVAQGAVLTVAGGKVLTASAGLAVNGGNITLDKTNILKDDFTVRTDLIKGFTTTGGVVTLDLAGTQYSSINLLSAGKLLFGENTGNTRLDFINGKFIINDEPDETGNAAEALVVYGETEDDTMTMSGMKTTVVSGIKIPGTGIEKGTKMMEVDTGDDEAVASLKTKTVRVVGNINDDKVESDLKTVKKISIITDTNGNSSQIIAKDLQINALAAGADNLVIEVGSVNGDTSSLTVTGSDTGIVKDAANMAVATAAIVRKGAVMTVGDENREQLGNSGSLVSLTVDGQFNLFETSLVVDRLQSGDVGNGGIIFVDPSYLNIKDISGLDNTVVQVDADGAVLNLGSKWDAAELETIVKQAGFGTKAYKKDNYTAGFVVDDGTTALMAISTRAQLSGTGGALIASKNTYDSSATGIHFDDNSLIVVDAKTAYEATLDGTAVISGLSDDPDISATSRLYLYADDYRFSEDQVLTILQGTNDAEITAENTWKKEQITLSDPDFQLESIVIAGNKYQLTVTETKDNSLIGDVIMRLKEADANGFKKYLGLVRTNTGGSKTAAYLNAMNTLGNLGEAAGVQHGTVTMAGQIGDMLGDNLGLLGRPALPTIRGYVKNTVSDIDDIKADIVATGKTEDIMPVSEIHMDKYPKQVWAGYVHNKENVTGLFLQGVNSDYTATYKGAVAGIDLKSSERVITGIALTYTDGNVSGTTGGISTHNEGKYYGISLYDRITFDDDKAVVLDIGYLHNESDIRQYNHGMEITASPKANAVIGGIRYEKSITLGKGQVIPYAAIRFMHMENRSYTNNFGMEYENDGKNILMPQIGISWAGEYGDKITGLFRPSVQCGYVWNKGDTDGKQTVSFGGASNSVGYDVADEHNWFAALGIQYAKSKFVLGLGYKYQKGESVKNSKWNINMGFEF